MLPTVSSVNKISLKWLFCTYVCFSNYNHFIFLNLGFMACQDYFTHFEQSQYLGGAKAGDLREKSPAQMQAEIGLSHM